MNHILVLKSPRCVGSNFFSFSYSIKVEMTNSVSPHTQTHTKNTEYGWKRYVVRTGVSGPLTVGRPGRTEGLVVSVPHSWRSVTEVNLPT